MIINNTLHSTIPQYPTISVNFDSPTIVKKLLYFKKGGADKFLSHIQKLDEGVWGYKGLKIIKSKTGVTVFDKNNNIKYISLYNKTVPKFLKYLETLI